MPSETSISEAAISDGESSSSRESTAKFGNIITTPHNNGVVTVKLTNISNISTAPFGSGNRP